jgi:hypothetical protein
MLKPARSPVRGYNHNVIYRGRVFHVQTEESGPGSPRISTHLYFGGTILASKRAEYDPAAAPEIVRGLMQSQHKSILRDLKSGRNDAHLLQFFTARGETLDGAAAGGAADDEFPDEGQTPHPIVVASPSSPAVSPPAGPPPVGATASLSAPLTPTPEVVQPVRPRAANPIIADALITFGDNFDDEPTNPEERTRAAAASAAGLAARAAKGTPALGSAVVRIERVVTLGEKTPAPVSFSARARRPAPSFPYVVQEGSHPVQDDGQAVLTPAPLVTTVTEPMVSPAMAAPVAAAPVSVVPSAAPAPSTTPPPVPPAAPLVPPAARPQAAPLTAGVSAAELGATPEAPVSREENQSLDEVIMAYLARGPDRDVGNGGNAG